MTLPQAVKDLVTAWITANPQTECRGPQRAALLAAIQAQLVAVNILKSPTQLDAALARLLQKRPV